MAGMIALVYLVAVVQLARHIFGVARVEHRSSVWAVPSLRGKHPNDAVFCAVGGNCRSRARIGELRGALGSRLLRQPAILQRVVPQEIFAEKIVDVAVPVSGSTKGIDTGGDGLDGVRVVSLVKFSQVVAVDFVKDPCFSSSEEQMRMWTGLIGEENRSAGA